MMRSNKNIKIFLNYFLGPILFAWLAFSIYNQVKSQPNLALSWQRIRESLEGSGSVFFGMAMLLMLVNWSIEALKWKIAIMNIQPINFSTAFRAVLSGVSFSVSTPNRIGEYMGRILYIDEGNRLRAIAVTIVGSMSQLIITLAAGFVAMLLLMDSLTADQLVSGYWVRAVLFIVFLGLLFLVLLYFRLSWLIRLLDRLPGSSRYAYFINPVEKFNSRLLIKLLLWSAVRYLVFILQYFLLFRLFGVEINWWQCLLSVSLVFLIMSIMPTIALVELGLRGEISLKILALFSSNSLGISLTTAGIWCINLVIPAVAGSLLILGIRVYKKRSASGGGKT